ncbi:MAG: hypothetical protein QOI10_3576, partial [Solirubrobacterales bacterium]|nr:hypothetical protein [Solirubrobacterales bacterium]
LYRTWPPAGEPIARLTELLEEGRTAGTHVTAA